MISQIKNKLQENLVNIKPRQDHLNHKIQYSIAKCIYCIFVSFSTRRVIMWAKKSIVLFVNYITMHTPDTAARRVLYIITKYL